MITRPWLSNEPLDIAKRLIERIEAGDLKTPGQWVDWLRLVGRLPARCRKWVWKKAAEELPNESVQYLKSWDRNARN